MAATSWPKVFPPLTSEEQRISDDFMHHRYELLSRPFGVIDRFNHHYPVQHRPQNFVRTLEIGAGTGEHLNYEELTDEQKRHYYTLEIRPSMSAEIEARFPEVQTITGDCQQRLPFADGYFDRVLAIHVLEHLPNLPAAIREMHRLCDKSAGVFSVVIPCEGSLAYTVARRISTQRIFERRYKRSYQWFIERERVNRPEEILAEISPYFEIEQRSFFPLPVPFIFCNLVIGLTLRPRRSVQSVAA